MKQEEKRYTISAHELNKFSYCPYQWYFEKVYGRKELRRLYQERNDRLGLADSTTSRLRKGERYHRRQFRRMKQKSFLKKAVILLLLVLLGYLWLNYGK